MRAVLRAAVAALLWGIAPLEARALPTDDRVFAAMKDELDRTTRKLRMEGMPGPYFVSYTVRKGTQAYIRASYGALESSVSVSFMDAGVQIRVGGHRFDNTHFLPSGFYPDQSVGQANASFEDDYDNLRFILWSLSDDAYKAALENLAKKKAFQEKRMISEIFDDLSREKPVQSFEPPALAAVDRGLWERRIKDLSRVFRSYPDIQKSEAGLNFQSGTRWLLTSEGAAARGSATAIAIDLSVNTQAADGLRLRDMALNLTVGSES